MFQNINGYGATLGLAVILTTYKIVSFIVGYLVIKLGYKLIQQGVKGEFNFSSEYKGVKGGLVSSSPGLLFVLLGTFVICFAIFSRNPLYINDTGNAGQQVETNNNPGSK